MTFTESVVKKVQEILGEGYEVVSNNVNKGNGAKYEGVCIREKGGEVGTMVYIDQDDDLDAVARRAVATFQNSHPSGEIAHITRKILSLEKSEFLENITAQLVISEGNGEYIEGKPNRRFLDMAVIYRYNLDALGEANGTIVITNQFAQIIGVREDELFRAAILNASKDKYTVICIEDLMKRISLNEIPEEVFTEEKTGMLVASNQESVYGATILLMDSELKKISLLMGGRSYYILPSSTHEVLIVPEYSADINTLREMVRSVNSDEGVIKREEILSNNVYKYDAKRKELSIA